MSGLERLFGPLSHQVFASVAKSFLSTPPLRSLEAQRSTTNYLMIIISYLVSLPMEIQAFHLIIPVKK